MRSLPLPAVLLLCAACRTPPGAVQGNAPSASEGAQAAIAAVLDDFHGAAARADGPRYFAHLTDDAVFLGTDAKERWTKSEFMAFCEPYFSKGQGWTYEPRERHVVAAGDCAWFDEKLWNEKYGECRGTGALRRANGEWKLVLYSLTLLVPNERAAEVVKLVRGR